jgi:two-component system sensor histidine kinase ArlS
MPIRWRLVMLSTLGLTGILTLFHFFAYTLVRDWLIRTEETMLTSKLNTVREVFRQEEMAFDPKWLVPWLQEGQAIQAVRDGKVAVKANRGIPETVFLKGDEAAPEKLIRKAGRKEVMILTIPLGHPGDRLEMYTDFSSTERYVRAIIWALAMASVVLLVLVVVGGYWMSTIAFRPVIRITREVQDFDPSKRTHRLAVPETGDEIQRLSEVFNSLLDRIYTLMQQQNRFVSDVSHELRTPIAVVRGYLDLLRRWGLKKPEVAEEAVQAMDQELRRLENLTDRLLRLARFEVEEPGEVETFSLSKLVEERVKRWRLVHRNLQISCFLPDIDVPFIGLKADLEELLDIFLDNAGKYTPAGGKIHVKLIREKDGLSLSVKDTGKGIPESDLPHVFKRFYRSRRGKSPGAGLGLSIARQIVKRYGGKMEIESQVGQGTVVTARFPVAEERQG